MSDPAPAAAASTEKPKKKAKNKSRNSVASASAPSVRKQPSKNQNGAKAAASEGAPVKREPSQSSSTVRKQPSQASSSVRKPAAVPSANDNTLLRVNFEIRGRVQGVHFRKYTQMKGTSLGLRGWCQNTEYNTVIGCMEGPRLKLDQMKQWLKSTGSPKSIITIAEFKDTRCDSYTLAPGFRIVR